MADRTSTTPNAPARSVEQEQYKGDLHATPPHWDGYIAIGQRQMRVLAEGALAIVVGMLALAVSGRVGLNVPLMLLLGATAGLSSMSAP
jgi:hypothetical protein